MARLPSIPGASCPGMLCQDSDSSVRGLVGQLHLGRDAEHEELTAILVSGTERSPATQAGRSARMSS